MTQRRTSTVREWLTLVIGLAGVVFVTAFWALTGRIDPLLVALFGSCIGLNEGVGALRELNRPPPQPPPKDGNS